MSPASAEPTRPNPRHEYDPLAETNGETTGNNSPHRDINLSVLANSTLNFCVQGEATDSEENWM